MVMKQQNSSHINSHEKSFMNENLLFIVFLRVPNFQKYGFMMISQTLANCFHGMAEIDICTSSGEAGGGQAVRLFSGTASPVLNWGKGKSSVCPFEKGGPAFVRDRRRPQTVIVATQETAGIDSGEKRIPPIRRKNAMPVGGKDAVRAWHTVKVTGLFPVF